jgi:hypothetical protein
LRSNKKGIVTKNSYRYYSSSSSVRVTRNSGINYLLQSRAYTSASSLNDTSFGNKFPVVCVYENAGLLKETITKDNRGKSGIYRWVNFKKGKSYEGSSVNLQVLIAIKIFQIQNERQKI